MTATSAWAGQPPSRTVAAMRRHRGAIVAFAVLIIAFVLLDLNLAQGFGYFDASSTASSAAALALAAMGATIVVIGGGLDLSAGAVISLTNCLIAAHVGDSAGSIMAWTTIGLLAGTATGLVNAALVVVFQLPSVIVTLATMFIVEGMTLLVLEQPGGAVPAALTSAFTGDAIPQLLPAPALVLSAAVAVWLAIRQTPLGTYIYAVGSDAEAARAKGVPVRAARFATYVIAGTFYGAAGVFLTAQTGSGDPTVGPPMLLPIFVAVVLGGTTFTGGRGGCVGTVFGALTLMLIVNLLLVFNVPTYYSTIVEGALLILAVLSGSLDRLAAFRRPDFRRRASLRLPLMPAAFGRGTAGPISMRRDDTLAGPAWRRWAVVNANALRFTLPSYFALLAIFALTAVVLGGRVSAGTYLNSLLVLSAFLAVLALGQGAVVISGGLDLSVPSVITLSGVLLTAWSNGSNEAAFWALPLACVAGAAFGALSGIGVAVLAIHPLIMTLSMNGILEGVALVYTGGTPSGSSPPALTWFMTGKVAGITPVVFGLLAFTAAAGTLLGRTVYGRHLLAVGNSRTVAFFSGVPVTSTTVATYALSGLCSALVGAMLVGFSGQAFNDMGEPYLLPAIAVVVIGGTAMTGGRGNYLGMLGGALLLTALSTFLSGLLMPVALRSVLFGVVILAAIVGLRGRTA